MTADRPDGMLKSELEIIRQLIRKHAVVSALEIGLANASSAIAILEELKSDPNAQLTSIDPYQNFSQSTAAQTVSGYAGSGLANIKQAGLDQQHQFIENTSYIALPKLVEQQKTYDLILIDGYHSFDFTFIDFFYADLLLKEGGLLLIHDSNMKSVYAVCKFILNNKNYSNIGPEITINASSLLSKLVRRFKFLLTGRYAEFKLRQRYWKSLAVLQKNSSTLCPEASLEDLGSLNI